MGNICGGSLRASLSDSKASPIVSVKKMRSKKRTSQFRNDSTEIIMLSASDYKNFRYVYEGRFGKVYSGTQVNGNHMVVFKFFGYSLAEPVEADIHNEIKLLCDLKGVDGIVQIQGVITDTISGLIPRKVHKKEYPIIVTEYLSGGDMSERLNRIGVISEKKISKIFRDIVLALDGLHSCRYIHRDLKLENLIFASSDDDSPVKIVDVGCAVRLPVKCKDGVYRDGQVVGTPGYLAPESIQYFDYSAASDVFQAGCVLYSMLSGLPAFNPLDQEQVTHRGCYNMEGLGWEGISSEAKSLVRSLLHRNPKYRITLSDILNHPWMVNEVPDIHLGIEHLTRFKHLALREKMKNFLKENEVDLGGGQDKVNQKLDAILPEFFRQSSSLSTVEGTPSPFKKVNPGSGGTRPRDSRASLESNLSDASFLTDISPCSPSANSCSDYKVKEKDRDEEQGPEAYCTSISSTKLRHLQAAEDLANGYSDGDGEDIVGRESKGERKTDIRSTHKYKKPPLTPKQMTATVERYMDPEQGQTPDMSFTSASLIDYVTFESIVLNSGLPELASPRVFRIFDKDRVGLVDIKEFLLTMLAFRAAENSNCSTKAACPESDSEFENEGGPSTPVKDPDGMPDSELVTAFQSSVTRYFKIFDLDQKGYVDMADLKVAVGCYFLDLSNPIRTSELYVHSMSRVESLMQNIKTTEEGKIDFSEFQKFYEGLLFMYGT